MKKLLLFNTVLFLSLSLNAQRFGYVDTDYILESLPQYQQAQSSLETQTNNWAKEIENHQNQLDELLVKFEGEKVLLTETQLKEKQQEIEDKRVEIKNLQEKRYGPNGDMLKTRQNLVKPIQDQVYNAVKTVADRRNYNFVFDKGSDLILLYSDPKFDISEEVIRILLPEGQEKVRPNTQRKNTNSTPSPRINDKANSQKRQVPDMRSASPKQEIKRK